MARVFSLPASSCPRSLATSIYLFDQLLRGRFDHRPRVLDAGCGDGRNLMYFLRRGFMCFGIARFDQMLLELWRVLACNGMHQEGLR